MRRGAIPGQGGNVCNLGLPEGSPTCPRSKWRSFSRFRTGWNQRYRANASHDRYPV